MHVSGLYREVNMQRRIAGVMAGHDHDERGASILLRELLKSRTLLDPAAKGAL